jgi:hypothetical protein
VNLKRLVIEARYAPELPSWYAVGQRVLWDDGPAPPRPAA